MAEGIDFDRHYGRLVIMFGVPFQYTLSRLATISSVATTLSHTKTTLQLSFEPFMVLYPCTKLVMALSRDILEGSIFLNNHGIMLLKLSKVMLQPF